ncbi:DUF6630 family protein [Hymenobacter properus]|uniref:DUF6630 domain-containing protein n=1 Tax=Hymenobacter properus TaxID=2791026 RepID=A0A931FKX9_9BACT|nr:hypothetical protein [Hymenobacter properus]MBF9143563.1 hypothetical protein [Hymenobacter properus]MBR7722376.1 hypothetical protein [Microvirga sp. SRT04]
MNTDKIQPFVQLFTLNDAEATQRVSERLALVLRDAAAYREQFADELDERGITAAMKLPEQELRDIALVDALSLEDLAWENDWKEDAAEMADGLNEILTRQQRGYALPTSALPGGRNRNAEALDALQDALEAKGLALVLYTLDSDSYPLGVVDDAQAEEARQLAQELGFKLTVY